MAPRARRNVSRQGAARRARQRLAVLVSGLVGLGLVAAVLELPRESVGLRGEVMRHLGESGVEHPVTAVLLTFRLYDTWLEAGVLLLAAVAALALQRARDLRRVENEPPASLVLAWTVRLLTPVMAVAGGYLLWLGKLAPGGAFQAGVILGAAGVLLRLAGFSTVNRLSRPALHLWLLLGFAAFLLLAFGRALAGAPILSYPRGWEEAAIMVLETLLTLSVAATVTVLVTAARPLPEPEENAGKP